MREYQRRTTDEFRLLCRRLGRNDQQVDTALRRAWIEKVKTLAGLVERRRAVQIRKRYISMAKVKVGKSVKAPEPQVEADDLGGDDIEGIDDLGAEDDDLLGDIGDLGDIAEVDDLGVTVEDVEAAMQSITPTQAGISDAATSALAADVGKLVKAFDGMAKASKSEKVLEAVDKMGEALGALGRGIQALTDAATKQHEWQMDAHKTLLNAVNNLTAKMAPAKSGPVLATPAAPAATKNFSELDAWLTKQFEGLPSGKSYPIEKVAEAFVKRHGSATLADITARIQVVYKAAIEKSTKPGAFTK